jgi:dCMP deaminase
MTPRLDWDEWFYKLAEFYSKRSKDPRKKVGCVVTLDGYQVGQGFNGFPRGIEDTEERLNNKKLKNDLMLHAEENALRIAGHQADTAYVYPCLPCTRCLGHLIQAGVTRIVTGPLDDDSGWQQPLVHELIIEKGIELMIIGED